MEPSTTLAGAKIRRWREAQGLSAEALGERIDPERIIPAQTVYNWETRGKVARPRLQKLLADKGVCSAADWLEPADEVEPLLATGTG